MDPRTQQGILGRQHPAWIRTHTDMHAPANRRSSQHASSAAGRILSGGSRRRSAQGRLALGISIKADQIVRKAAPDTMPRPGNYCTSDTCVVCVKASRPSLEVNAGRADLNPSGAGAQAMDLCLRASHTAHGAYQSRVVLKPRGDNAVSQ